MSLDVLSVSDDGKWICVDGEWIPMSPGSLTEGEHGWSSWLIPLENQCAILVMLEHGTTELDHMGTLFWMPSSDPRLVVDECAWLKCCIHGGRIHVKHEDCAGSNHWSETITHVDDLKSWPKGLGRMEVVVHEG